jgi:hypothetical protein
LAISKVTSLLLSTIAYFIAAFFTKRWLNEMGRRTKFDYLHPGIENYPVPGI